MLKFIGEELFNLKYLILPEFMNLAINIDLRHLELTSQDMPILLVQNQFSLIGLTFKDIFI